MERRVIIEGMNLSGKTSICGMLEKRYTNSTCITVHGYYNQEIVERFSGDGKNDYGRMMAYARQRLNGFLGLLKTSLDDVIFNRFHLTDVVYLKLFHGKVEHYHDLEEELNNLGVYLVLLDMDDETLRERLSKREREGKSGDWDKDLGNLVRKRDLYRWAFENSKIKNKVKIDSSKLSLQEELDYITGLLER